MTFRRGMVLLVILIYLACLWMALTQATFGGETLLYNAAKEKRWTAVHFLVAIGADINADGLPKTRPGWTPLHYAAENGTKESVEQLVALGARADKQDAEGRTPLHQSIVWNKPELLALMLDSGIDANKKYKDGRTLLQFNAEGGGSLETMRVLLDHGADPNCRNLNGFTPLHQIVGTGDVREAELLLKRGADVNARSTDGWTPLAMASTFLFYDKVELFLVKGADPNGRISKGETPLHLVAANPKWRQTGLSENYRKPLQVVEALLSHGADINARDTAGKTPLDLAREAGNQAAVDFLRAHGGRE